MGGNDRIWDTPVKQDSDTVSIPKFSYKHPRHFYTGVPPGLTRDVGQKSSPSGPGPSGELFKVVLY